MNKGTVSFGRTVSVRRYNTVRIEWSEEFDMTAKSHEDAAKSLQVRVDKFLTDLGVTIL